MRIIIKLDRLRPNPDNPRTISKEKFEKLVTSIRQFPQMLDARPIVVNQDYVVLGGNMRLEALKAAGIDEVEVEVVDWSEDQQKEFIVKDNVEFGSWDWDELANKFDVPELINWGMDAFRFDSAEAMFNLDESDSDATSNQDQDGDGLVALPIKLHKRHQEELMRIIKVYSKKNECSLGDALFYLVKRPQ